MLHMQEHTQACYITTKDITYWKQQKTITLRMCKASLLHMIAFIHCLYNDLHRIQVINLKLPLPHVQVMHI